MAWAATAQVWTCLALNSSGRQRWDDFAQSLKARRTYASGAICSEVLRRVFPRAWSKGCSMPEVASSAPHLSLLTLFLQADYIVKGVMVGLLVCSVWVWAIAVDKIILYTRTSRAMDRFEQAFWSGQSLEELYRSISSRPNHSMAALFVAAMREWKRSLEGQARSFAGLQMRIEKVMDVTIAREVERLENRLLVLATVGSAGPFVGLFGTVWGIMNSFQSIAASKNTSLAVVAPGIAEALFATAIGLVAAIPATIFYNKFSSEVNKQAQRLEGFADEFAAILSRQIDERG
jgi:biopolymer transport protein TolQ